MYLTYTSRMMECRRDGYEEGLHTGLTTGREEGISIGLATGREEGISIGLERGAYENKLETAKAMFLDKIPVETISKYTSLPLETVLELVQTE